MVWAVVKFVKENSVEAVPNSWYVEQSDECFWPPLNFKKSRIVHLIETSADPLSDWIIHPAVLLGKYEDLRIAQKKAKKAEVTSDLSSNSECYKGRGFRRPKQNPKYHSEYDSSRESSSDDDNTYPTMQKNAFGPISTTPVYKRRSRSTSPERKRKNCETPPRRSLSAPDNNSIEMDTGSFLMSTHKNTISQPTRDNQSCATRPSNSSRYFNNHNDKKRSLCAPDNKSIEMDTGLLSMSTNKNIFSQPNSDNQFHAVRSAISTSYPNNINNTSVEVASGSFISSENTSNNEIQNLRVPPKDADFERIVLNEISLLHLKLNSVIDKIDTLTKLKRMDGERSLKLFDKDVQSFYEKIPIKDPQTLEVLEDWLNNQSNYRLMIAELNRIGGVSLPQTLRKILYRVLSNEVANLYSWDGAKMKKPFKNLKLAKVLLDTMKMHYQDSTENDAIVVIKSWLVKAKERLRRAGEKHEEPDNRDLNE